MSIRKALDNRRSHPQAGAANANAPGTNQHGADPAPVCATCNGLRHVRAPAQDHARVMRCPSCFTTCTRCGGTGAIFTPNGFGSWDSSPCDACSPTDRKIQLFNDAGIPRRYEEATFRSFEVGHDASLSRAHTWLRRWAAEMRVGDRGILLSGSVGSGKTFLMAATLRNLTLLRSIPTRFVEFTHLLSEIRSGYDEGRNEADIIEHLVDIPVLCIDELGKGLKTEWQIAILDELISKRYNRSVTTLFTTNFPIDGRQVEGRSRGADDFRVATLEERIGARMFSRLYEMTDLMTITAPDYRRRSRPG